MVSQEPAKLSNPQGLSGFESRWLRQEQRSTICLVMYSVGREEHAKMEVICQSRKPGRLGSSPGASRKS